MTEWRRVTIVKGSVPARSVPAGSVAPCPDRILVGSVLARSLPDGTRAEDSILDPCQTVPGAEDAMPDAKTSNPIQKPRPPILSEVDFSDVWGLPTSPTIAIDGTSGAGKG